MAGSVGADAALLVVSVVNLNEDQNPFESEHVLLAFTLGIK